MKRLAVVAAAVSLWATGASAVDVPGFAKTWAQAKKLAEADHKPIYLHFTTDWCGWCRKIEKDIYATKEGQEALKPFVAASLDCTVPRGEEPTGEAKINLELMHKWGGSGYPFLVQVTPDGTVLNSWAGYKPMDAFQAELQEASKVYKEYKEFEAQAATADKNSLDYNVKAMEVYAKVRRFDLAQKAAEAVRKLDPKNEKGQGAKAAAILLAAAQAQDDQAKAAAALADIRKLDPKNENGILEKAVFSQALATLKQAGRTPEPEKRKEILTGAITALGELTASGAKLKDPQNDYHLLGFLHMVAGDKAKALEALKKALAVDPKSQMASSIQKRIEQLAGAAPKPE